MVSDIVGIIGGAGRMGSNFAEVFRSSGYTVIIADQNEIALKNMRAQGFSTASAEDVADNANLLVFSVPIIDTPDIIRQYAPRVRGLGRGISDLTSTKVEPIRAMLETANDEVEIVGMHPMYGPNVDMEGQNVVLVPARPFPGEFTWQKKLETLIEDNDASYFHASAQDHDHYMSLVQGLPHAVQFIAAETFRNLEINMPELAKYSSKFYDMFFDVLWRVFAMDNPELYGQIQKGNPNNVVILDAMEVALQAHKERITTGTLDDFASAYGANRDFLGKYAEIGVQRTSELAGKPKGTLIYFATEDQEKIEAFAKVELNAEPYKEWLSTARVNEGELGRVVRHSVFAKYTTLKRKLDNVERTRLLIAGEPVPIERQEGTYQFITKKKHPNQTEKGLLFSPIIPLDPEKERHPNQVRYQMRNTFMDPWLNLFQTWYENPELHQVGILVAGQTKGQDK